MNPARKLDWDKIRTRLAASEQAIQRGFERTAGELAEVLDRRAAALADRAATRRARTKGDQVLVVALGGARFGLPLARLAEVVPLKWLTTVPLGPAELLGVVNLRGEVRSVVDLRGVLQPACDREHGDGYVLMVHGENKVVGLFVEQVEGITLVEREALAPAPDARYVAGMLPGRIGLIDVDAVLAHDVFAGNVMQGKA